MFTACLDNRSGTPPVMHGEDGMAFCRQGGERIATRQLDGLKDLGHAFGNDGDRLWTMSNGYALCTAEGLAEIADRIEGAGTTQVDTWRDLLRIGVQWDAEVTDRTEPPRPTVSQAFCSALPVAYGDGPEERWRVFATLVLEALYEATLWAAVINAARGASPKVLLTRVGGGAFGNPPAWIDGAMRLGLAPGKGPEPRGQVGQSRTSRTGVAGARSGV